MLSTVITVSTVMVWFSVFAGVLFVVTFIMLAFYLPAASKLKAHRNTTGGNLVGLVAETLEGLSVVQAFGKTEYFVQTAIQRNDAHHRAVFTGESLNLWLAHWCDLYGAILVLAVSCFAVGLAEDLGAATVGLAFSNTIQMLVSKSQTHLRWHLSSATSANEQSQLWTGSCRSSSHQHLCLSCRQRASLCAPLTIIHAAPATGVLHLVCALHGRVAVRHVLG